MEKAYLKSLLILTDIFELHDPCIGGHLWQISQFAKLLAVKTGLMEVKAIQINIGRLLHDLGKIGILDAI